MALGTIRRKGILFGCDNFATVVDEQLPSKNENGIMMKQYLIIPHDDLKDAYPEIFKNPDALNIKTEIGMAMWREYPVYWVCDENPSRKNAIARVDCRFDGRETPHTQRRTHMTDQIKTLEMENETLRVSNIVLQEEKRELLGETLILARKLAELREIMEGESGGTKSEDENYGAEEK